MDASTPTVFDVELVYDQEDGRPLSPPKRATVSITPDLAAVFARAAIVNQGDRTPLSFTSLLVGMVTARDSWLEKELDQQGVDTASIGSARGRSYDPEKVRSANARSLTTEYLTSESARRAIEKAGAISAELKEGAPIDVRHLTAAYPVLENWHLQDFADLGIDRLAWCRAFGAVMAREFPDERWYWRSYADRASPVPLTSFSADVYTERDLLGIDRTVDALALLIASTHTHTPLSIGVFGPWGSGKTFFMRHLRSRIMELARQEQRRASGWEQARARDEAKAEDAPRYFGQVAQVEFNAWHYNESNLIASLVEHLFRNLRVLPDSLDVELEERRAKVLLQLSGLKANVKDAADTIQQAQATVESAKVEVTRANGDVESARRGVDEKARELEETSQELRGERRKLDDAVRDLTTAPSSIDTGAIVKVALEPLESLAERAREAANEVDGAVSSWTNFFKRVLSVRGLAVVTLCVAAPLVAWLSDWLTDLVATLTGMAATAVAGLGNTIAVLQERRAQFEERMKALKAEEDRRLAERQARLNRERQELEGRYQGMIEALSQKLEEQRAALAVKEGAVATAVHALADRTKDLDDKVKARASAEARLHEVEAELKRLSSALLLEEFIKDRSTTDEYRKQLGFLALVRRDFERLSDLVAGANKDWCDPKQKTPPPLLNRIVLYIDDLDRCKESTVLAVLEAVHLLLAFPLFVCAVAVDPRWVEKCLRERHQHLFVDETPEPPASSGAAPPVAAHATVGDYLEKIFQIPMWMSPIDSRKRAAVVKSLLGPSASPQRRGAAGEARRDTALDAAPEGSMVAPRGGAFSTLVAKAGETPDPLLITKEEAAHVDRVGPLLSARPRALKRFVNTYRLLKASLPDIDRDTFVSNDPSSPHRICISQLAFFTGQPRLATLLVRELEQEATTPVTVAAWFDTLPPLIRSPLEETFALIPDSALVSFQAFRAWLPHTSRYLFHKAD